MFLSYTLLPALLLFKGNTVVAGPGNVIAGICKLHVRPFQGSLSGLFYIILDTEIEEEREHPR